MTFVQEMLRNYKANENSIINYRPNPTRYKTKMTERQREVLEVIKSMGAGKGVDIKNELGEKTVPQLVVNFLVDRGHVQFDEDEKIYFTSENALDEYLNKPCKMSKIKQCIEFAKKVGTFHISQLSHITDDPSAFVHRMKKLGLLVRKSPGVWKYEKNH